MSVELKVIEKVRRVLIDDTTVRGYVQDRVYGEHLSTVNNPIFPAISMHLMDGQPRTNIPDMVNITIQIDFWFPVDKYAFDAVMECFSRVRALLHRQSLSDTTIGVKIQQFFEGAVGPQMYDEETKCHHLPVRYNTVAI